jgi:tRNA pseudouridine38-40 synthase
MSASASSFQRFRIDVAYDGRRFDGWQSQPDGNTIQDHLLAAAKRVCPAVATIQGSGRTDAGVSAAGQVAHFDVPADWRMGPAEWQKAFNANLPAAIRILGCEAVSAEFHARFSAEGKCYVYRIETGEVLPPLLAGLAWHRRGFDPDGRLEEVVRLFEGTHDFRSFSANRNDGKDGSRDTIRVISSVTVDREEAGSIRIRFCGNGFLYKMVRFLVGSAVYCIEGKFPPPEIIALLQGADRDRKAPFCAPADGLTLEQVFYPPELTPKS